MRKNDERYPRHERDSDDKGSQNELGTTWTIRFDTFQRIAKICGFENYDVNNLDVIRKLAEALPEKLNMSAIPPVLPSRDELNKVNEVQHRLKRYPHLEYCYFASNSAIAGLREFYFEVAHLKGEPSESACKKGLLSLETVIKALQLLDRMQVRAKKALVWAENQWGSVDQSNLRSDVGSEKEINKFNKFYKIVEKFYEASLKSYGSIVEVVETSWDYLPVELQQALESLARQIVVHAPQFEKLETELPGNSLRKYFLDLENVCNTLAVSVFAAVESSKHKRKLYMLKLFEGWDFSGETSEQKLTVSLAMTEIQELTQNLANLSGVTQAEAVSHSSTDLHRITFHLKLLPHTEQASGFDNIEDLWEVAERMALRAHRRLRELTREKWYFHVALDEGFSDYPNSNPIVAVAHALSDNSHSTS